MASSQPHDNTHLSIYTDGGARGNPGPAGIGIVITTPSLQKEGKHVEEISAFIGNATNNVAEYAALHRGLSRARDLGAHFVDVYMDSELVVRQMKREYKVKDKELARWFVKVWNLCQTFKTITFTHIPRERNAQADALANKAIDQEE